MFYSLNALTNTPYYKCTTNGTGQSSTAPILDNSNTTIIVKNTNSIDINVDITELIPSTVIFH